MNQFKLYQKCEKRVGMKVIETKEMKAGTIIEFDIKVNIDGTFDVHYIVSFKGERHAWLEKHHESNIVLMKGTEL